MILIQTFELARDFSPNYATTDICKNILEKFNHDGYRQRYRHSDRDADKQTDRQTDGTAIPTAKRELATFS